jgi:hypothetical protein
MENLETMFFQPLRQMREQFNDQYPGYDHLFMFMEEVAEAYKFLNTGVLKELQARADGYTGQDVSNTVPQQLSMLIMWVITAILNRHDGNIFAQCWNAAYELRESIKVALNVS